MEVNKQQIVDFVKLMTLEQKNQLLSVLKDNLTTTMLKDVSTPSIKIEDLDTEYQKHKVKILDREYLAIIGFEEPEELRAELRRLKEDKNLIVNKAIFKNIYDKLGDNELHHINNTDDDCFDMMIVINDGLVLDGVDYIGEYCDHKIFDYDDEVNDVINDCRSYLNNHDFENLESIASEFQNIQNEYNNLGVDEILLFRNNDYSNYDTIDRYCMIFENDDSEYITMGLLISESL